MTSVPKVPLLALTAALIAGGCAPPRTGRPSGKAAQAAPPAAVPSPAATVTSQSAKPATSSDLSAAQDAARAFLQSAAHGDAAGAAKRMTDRLKRVEGPATLPSEQAAGFSGADVARWLERQTKGVGDFAFTSSVLSPDGSGASLGGSAAGDRKARFLVRLQKAGGNWLVDAFRVTELPPPALPNAAADPELAWAREHALGFLDAWLSGAAQSAEAQLTADLKKRLAPPRFASEEADGYARTELRRWLARTAQGVTGYAVEAQDAPAAFRGTVTAGDRKSAFALKLARDGDRWAVSDLQVTPTN